MESAHQVDVAVGSLDEPSAVWPRDHIWDTSRIPWAHIADGLPRRRGERGE
ncbi:MAG: hypothetical protein QF450_02545 [Rhodospirillales bacterium]|nr:hypothetical protein [Rhodospirillales bacterium]HJO71840.1 hypothetical protein [Rhodospirillales bacterium]